MFARVGMLRALNSHVERVLAFNLVCSPGSQGFAPDRPAPPRGSAAGALLEAEQMKARPPKDWSQNELKRLEAGATRKASAGEIATSLGRPTASVRRMA
jgi:hypothetical protein